MKIKLFLIPSLLLASVLFFSCNKDDDDSGHKPANPVISAFNTKYPGAQNATWEKAGAYEKAEFTYNNMQNEAWFAKDGTWILTETDMAYKELPANVQSGLTNSIYSSWNADDDAEKMEGINLDPLYLIDIKNGNNEMILGFNDAGNIVKQANNSENGSSLPNTVTNFINTKYTNSPIIEAFSLETHETEVDIINDNKVKEVLFDQNNQWIMTQWKVLLADVPEKVLNVLNYPAYSGYEVDMAKYQQYQNGQEYYNLLLKKTGSLDMSVNVYPDGNLVLY
ncbi:MAG TPA: PepSY-like domain-containing protein [Candidatus Avirikenella pullistercoris]|nr:PepSY-like domain-containing protein [Candidatus Avirikenella pullistercoris]